MLLNRGVATAAFSADVIEVAGGHVAADRAVVRQADRLAGPRGLVHVLEIAELIARDPGEPAFAGTLGRRRPIVIPRGTARPTRRPPLRPRKVRAAGAAAES